MSTDSSPSSLNLPAGSMAPGSRPSSVATVAVTRSPAWARVSAGPVTPPGSSSGVTVVPAAGSAAALDRAGRQVGEVGTGHDAVLVPVDCRSADQRLGDGAADLAAITVAAAEGASHGHILTCRFGGLLDAAQQDRVRAALDEMATAVLQCPPDGGSEPDRLAEVAEPVLRAQGSGVEGGAGHGRDECGPD